MRSIARALVLALVVAGVAGSLLGPSTQPVLGLTLVAVPDTLTIVHDRTAVVPAPGVLGNDVGLLGGATAVLDGPPSHGSVTLRPDGGYTYAPNAGYVGTDVFHYHARNGGILPLNSTSTTVTITITNGTPVARNDAYTTTVAGTRTVSAPGVMANDVDPDGDPMQSSLVTGPAHGTVSLAPDGSFGYASVAGFSGTDSFTYRVSDGIAASASASVTLTIPAPPPTPTPPPPTPTPPPPTPTPSLPLPSLPLPTLPLPSLPLPTIRPTLRPSLPPTLPPLLTPSPSQPTPSPSGAPGTSGPPVGGGPVASPGSPGVAAGGPAPDPFTVGGRTGAPLDGLVNIDVPTIGGLEWAVPALVLTVPGLLLILAIAIQAVVGGAVWVPFVRRWLGFGLRRRRREARATR